MNDESRELVFVYGTLRQHASNAFRMKGATWEGVRVVPGRLYQISWYPGLVVDPQGGMVVGELFRVTLSQLRELDEFEGVPEGQLEGDEYRRVRVLTEPAPESGGLPEWEVGFEDVGVTEAWVWEWKGDPANAQLIGTGDWLDVEAPKQGPLFTSIGCLGVLAFTIGLPFLVQVVATLLNTPVPDVVRTSIGPVGAVLSMAVGIYALRMATKRREPGHGFQVMLGIALVFLGLGIFLGFILLLVSLLSSLV